MAVGPIGNAIYVNQQTSSVSSIQNAHNNRVDVQNFMAQAAANDKEKEVLEVRPAEENHAVDPDREHQKNEADQETERNEKQEKDSEEAQTSKKSSHVLDIKV